MVCSVEDLKRTLHFKDPLPGEERLSYHTLAGFLVYLLDDLQKKGSRVRCQGYTFEVVDLDGNRIDQVLIQKIPGQEGQ
ncbi:transporter associated domain-containing protein [Bacillus sp. 1P06AnD]|uniref:transporter associated domain-containing protein n=1 Tax=Bacillus sp. 1P06AnD TaxID=3132208 RepID=UPI00399F89C3